MILKRIQDGMVNVTFILPANIGCAPVSVVGSFNDWQPYRHPMIRRPDGTISTTVVSPPGATLHFRYLGNDGTWFDDMDADRVTEHGSIVHT